MLIYDFPDSVMEQLNLPIGVYYVDIAGQLIACNQRARQILNIPEDADVRKISITQFYANPAERNELLSEVHQAEAENRVMEKRIVSFVIENKTCFVQLHCRSEFAASDQRCGYVGCILDYSNEERYRQMFERLPIGLYRLNADDEIIYANDAFARVFGYEHPHEMLNHPLRDYYYSPEEAQSFRKEAIKAQTLIDRKIKMRDRNRQPICLSLSVFALTDQNGNYAGRQGAMIDVTGDMTLRDLMERGPVGIFQVKTIKGVDVIYKCNQKFAGIIGVGSPEEATGINVKDLFKNPHEYEELKNTLSELAEIDRPLQGYNFEIISMDGHLKTIEINASLFKREKGNSYGCVGMARDVSTENMTSNRLNELSNHFGNVYHAYAAALLRIRAVVNVIDKYFTVSYPEKNTSDSTAGLPRKIEKAIHRLTQSVERVVELHSSQEDDENATNRIYLEKLNKYYNFLQNSEKKIRYNEFRHSTMRDLALKIYELTYTLKRGSYRKQEIRQLRDDADDLIRKTTLISNKEAMEAIVEADHHLRILRSLVTTGNLPNENETVRHYAAIVHDAIREMDEFSAKKGIRFRVNLEEDIKVKVREKEFLRAIVNLLHNAVKYTWVSPNKGKTVIDDPIDRWVTVRLKQVDLKCELQIENYGVGIAEEEIKRGLIFHIGYRGIASGKKGRAGSGIGLYDSQQILLTHNGKLIITSHPASPGFERDNFSKPYITTVTVRLPVYIS